MFSVLSVVKNSFRMSIECGVPRIKRHTKSTHANSTPATDNASAMTADTVLELIGEE